MERRPESQSSAESSRVPGVSVTAARARQEEERLARRVYTDYMQHCVWRPSSCIAYDQRGRGVSLLVAAHGAWMGAGSLVLERARLAGARQDVVCTLTHPSHTRAPPLVFLLRRQKVSIGGRVRPFRCQSFLAHRHEPFLDNGLGLVHHALHEGLTRWDIINKAHDWPARPYAGVDVPCFLEGCAVVLPAR